MNESSLSSQAQAISGPSILAFRLCLAFSGASAQYVRMDEDGVHFAACRDGSPFSMWWCFGLTRDTLAAAARQKEAPLHAPRKAPKDVPSLLLPCIWEKTSEVLGSSGLARCVPVYRASDGVWRRVPKRFCRFEPEQERFVFYVPLSGDSVELAYCYPYGLEDVQALLQSLERNHNVDIRAIGHSAHGRPFWLLKMGKGSFHIWLTARHHSGETPGSYVLEGLLRRASRWPELLDHVTIYAVPVMDVDGVAEGMYGKDRPPRDFNRDYVASPCRPEIAAFIREAEKIGRADVFIDLHAPAPGDVSFLVPVCETLASARHWQRCWDLGRTLEMLAPASCPVRVADMSQGALNWSGDEIMQTATYFFYKRFRAMAMTLETSYHYAWHNKLLTPKSWRALGEALLQALALEAGLFSRFSITHIPRPPLLVPRLKNWILVSWPPLPVREGQEAVQIEAAQPVSGGIMSRRLITTPRAQERSLSFVYRLKGEPADLKIVLKCFSPSSNLPTGEIERFTITLPPSRSWKKIVFNSPYRTYRIILRLQNFCGRLEIKNF